MNRIFIEANRVETPECCFLETILESEFSGKSYEFICMNGVANLFNQANLNKIKIATEEGDKVIVILDADTPNKKWGFAARKADVEKKMQENGVDFPLFLYPNNHDDGDFETLLESLARKELHQEGGIVSLTMRHAYLEFVMSMAITNMKSPTVKPSCIHS